VRQIVSLPLFALLFTPKLLLSAAPQPAAFEAASIKTVVPGATGYEGTSRSKVEYTPNRLTMSNVGLNDCIQWAYETREDQISGGNDLGGERYDIRAKSAPPVAVSRLRIMLQDLLAKRFGLTVRREPRLLPVYELTVEMRRRRWLSFRRNCRCCAASSGRCSITRDQGVLRHHAEGRSNGRAAGRRLVLRAP